eukprot:Protomagalhaensia_sp_Gyna_25__398@NODE_118_length_5105_cov_114_513028_g92_i0_p2_GENE_NODE_118_length_5105_cov_114_513028_g92_i0NODE_118_length_5105_cov_114_513028_g92_i0_p2_ORF_typecomplete_len302_score50_96SRP19/PF01922_17/0_00016SRP19/PF01922_17/1_2e04_NODE_118_length_5105_cov_114_513028_g92_i015972502
MVPPIYSNPWQKTPADGMEEGSSDLEESCETVSQKYLLGPGVKEAELARMMSWLAVAPEKIDNLLNLHGGLPSSEAREVAEACNMLKLKWVLVDTCYPDDFLDKGCVRVNANGDHKMVLRRIVSAVLQSSRRQERDAQRLRMAGSSAEVERLARLMKAARKKASGLMGNLTSPTKTKKKAQAQPKQSSAAVRRAKRVIKEQEAKVKPPPPITETDRANYKRADLFPPRPTILQLKKPSPLKSKPPKSSPKRQSQVNQPSRKKARKKARSNDAERLRKPQQQQPNKKKNKKRPTSSTTGVKN